MGDFALEGIRVVELADETAEYVGLVLAGLGAEVIKVEPPGGSPTRRIGPFLDDVEDGERSLHFWVYNRGKRSVVLDLQAERDRFLELLASADVLIDSTPTEYLGQLGLAREDLLSRFPQLVISRVTPFGDDGPWASYKGSDLVHLALGGEVMSCGYSPRPDGTYDLPPIAGQAWHAYHIAGEQTAVMTIAALYYRQKTGEGQLVSCAIHEAVAKATENDVMNWVMRRAPQFRQTAQHAGETIGLIPPLFHTKDGRWFHVWLGGIPREKVVGFLEKYITAVDGSGIEGLVGDNVRMTEFMQRLFGRYTFDEAPWHEAQEAGLMIVPVRRPEENIGDGHWRTRKTFAEIEHPEHQRSFTYVTSRWISTATEWKAGRRAPLLDEDGASVMSSLQGESRQAKIVPTLAATPKRFSPHGKPFALDGIRVFDFSWRLASAGGTRFLAAMGADVIKVEWSTHPDSRTGAQAPVGGREARRLATGPLPPVNDSDMGGHFNNKNSGKRGMALNVTQPEGMDIARRLIAMSDIVAEGFSPGVFKRWGLSYEQLCEIKPDIIYAQQSGYGQGGTYGRYRAMGPIAQSLSGVTDMSGFPEPMLPAGWGYSFLDWMGAYSFGLALMSALYYRDQTGKGQWIDASQTEEGIFVSGVPILDYSANGRTWERSGNRSLWKAAAPQGIYRSAGEDRWIAIACFTDAEWDALVRVAEHPEWATDRRFANLPTRLANQDALDQVISSWTEQHDRYELMFALQQAGVPAGVCQTGEDKVDADPQLAALNWLTEVTGTKIGTWPVGEVPVKMSVTPPYIGGPIDRGAPIYGEDNEHILGELLGYSEKDVIRLAEEGVIEMSSLLPE